MAVPFEKRLFTPDEVKRLMRFSIDRRGPMIKAEIRGRLASTTFALLSAHEKKKYLLHSINIANLPADDILFLCLCLATLLAICLWGINPLFSIFFSVFIFGLTAKLLAKVFPSPERPLLDYYKEALGEIERSLPPEPKPDPEPEAVHFIQKGQIFVQASTFSGKGEYVHGAFIFSEGKVHLFSVPNIVAITLMSEKDAKKFAAKVGWGAAAYVGLGLIGFLPAVLGAGAALMSTGNIKMISYLVTLNSGHQFIITSPDKIYFEIKSKFLA